MDRGTRLQRTSILCQHTLRNFAYLEAMAEREADWDQIHFWITTHNNFLDTGILEWCKLFTEAGGKHHWSATVTDPALFTATLLRTVERTEPEFNEYKDKLRGYRNRFLAHLDDHNTYRLPKLDAAKASTKLLLRWILEIEDDCAALPKDHIAAEEFYALCLQQARSAMRGEA